MPGKTDVYRVVYVDGQGNHTALCFQEPVEGLSFQWKELFNLDSGAWAGTNDEGNIPHREPADWGPEGGGLTWHYQK